MFGALCVILCCQQAVLGQLTRQEFTEAIGVLAVDPGTLAACGVPSSAVEPLWATVESDSARWLRYVQAREALRSAGQPVGDGSTADVLAQIDQAEIHLRQVVSGWRESVLALVPAPHADKVRSVGLQRELPLPVWLQTTGWSAEQAQALERGLAAVRNGVRHDRPAEGADADFYLSALEVAEIAESKSNFEVLGPIYTDRMTQFLTRSE
jgi:hypothetical protein